jgi:hypothetical protein
MIALREWREAAVPDHFRRHPLQDLFGAGFLKHLKIGVAVEVDKARRHRKRTAIEHGAIDGRPYDADLNNATGIDQDVAANRRSAGSIKEEAILEKQPGG